MAAPSITAFVVDCVYVPEGKTDEFRNARIKMEMEEEELNLIITPEASMNRAEVEEMLSFLLKDRLHRMRIDLEKDCNIYVINDTKRHRVIMDGQRVAGLE